MGTEEAMPRSGKTKAPSSLPPAPAPALFLVRTRPRTTSKVMGVDSPRRPSTPPLRSRVTVPFLWEDTPGKPKLPQTAHRAPLFFFPPAATEIPALARDHEGGRAVPLKLPPRLQTAAEYSVSSPRTVLHGPYLGGKKPPRPLRRSESTAGRLLSWRKATAASKKGGHDHYDAAAPAPDASCSSPPGSSASSSSSSSMSYFFDDHSRRSHWRQQADAQEESEDGGAGQGSVRITRFRRNSSLPNITTSRLWASVRKGVKQINPWS